MPFIVQGASNELMFLQNIFDTYFQSHKYTIRTQPGQTQPGQTQPGQDTIWKMISGCITMVPYIQTQGQPKDWVSFDPLCPFRFLPGWDLPPPPFLQDIKQS